MSTAIGVIRATTTIAIGSAVALMLSDVGRKLLHQLVAAAKEIYAGSATSGWDKNQTQEEFMYKDECILLDKDDNVVGHANKKESHVFKPEAPRALLHRAFSVFLFDDQGRLLLQKRASTKITFPNVWTNTCCSHPLYGFTPTEVDTPEDVAAGTVMGAKRAAIRKLDHELGIPPSTLDINSFKFLTRLHYWAADVVTHGTASPWGEHEIDYILFIKASNVPVEPHPDEVDDVKWVTLEELKVWRERGPARARGEGAVVHHVHRAGDDEAREWAPLVPMVQDHRRALPRQLVEGPGPNPHDGQVCRPPDDPPL